MHHGNAVRRSLRGFRKRNKLPTPQHFAAIAAVKPRYDLHQRGFTRAVFAHQEVYFAFAHLQVAVAQSVHAAEAFANTFQGEQHSASVSTEVLRCGRRAFIPGQWAARPAPGRQGCEPQTPAPLRSAPASGGTIRRFLRCPPPASKFSKMADTGMRVSWNTGAPLSLPGTLSTAGQFDQSSCPGGVIRSCHERRHR